MPQNNPVGSLGKSASIESDTFNQDNLIQSTIDVNTWYRRQIIPIPSNFTSILFVLYVRSTDASGGLKFIIQQEFEPNAFTTPIVTETLVAAGALGAPTVCENGYGPAFARRTQSGAVLGNVTGLGINVPLSNTGGASNVWENIPLLFPIIAITRAFGAGGIRPTDLDATLYWNFWR